MDTTRKSTERAIAQCVDLMRFRHYSLNTEKTYCHHIGSYIDWLERHGRDLPDSRSRVEAFLTSMAHRGCSASTQNQAFNALIFLYEQVRKQKIENIQALRAKQSRHHRTALSQDQTLALLDAVPDISGYPVRLVTQLLYGCGMRVSEPLNLRIKDIDPRAWRLTLRGCKGGKDRTVIVPFRLREAMSKQIEFARALWQRDRETVLPVEVPGLLARKYPKAPHAWQWFWLFPAISPCRHPRTGETVRWRMHEANVQRGMRVAAARLGLEGLATPHVLRHCYATHVLAAGENIRSVQNALGHASLETTMIYVHGDGERVQSPLDAAPGNIIPFQHSKAA